MKQKHQTKLFTSQKGFTLLEILVVLTIMGFLIAMVAPRLAGISGDAVDTVCDTNQNRMVTYMSTYFEKSNRFPNLLTNLVEETGSNTYQIPAVADDDPDNGAETMASEMYDRNHFHIHYLNAAEIKELKNMGIVSLYNLNAYDGQNDDGSALKDGYDADVGDTTYVAVAEADQGSGMEKITLNATETTPGTLDNPIAVAMVGMGITAGGTTWDIADTERGWGEVDFIGRIILGMSAESGLIKDGIIANAAHCPGGIQNADNATYNDYNLVVPRLQSTVDRFLSDTEVATGVPTDITAFSYGEDDTEPSGTLTAVRDGNYTERSFTLEAQETWQFATMCPEGHMYPADDGDFWAIDFGGATASTID